jgi:hypothetical protein
MRNPRLFVACWALVITTLIHGSYLFSVAAFCGFLYGLLAELEERGI